MTALFCNGEGMRGGAVHENLSGEPFLGEATTAPRYRFYSVRDEFPGVLDVGTGTGGAVRGELYDVELRTLLDRFLPGEPSELELGVVDEAAFERTTAAGVPMVMDTCPAIEWRNSR